MLGIRLLRAVVAASALTATVVVSTPATARATSIDIGGSATVTASSNTSTTTVDASASASVTVSSSGSPQPAQGGLAKAFAGMPTTLLQGLLCPIATSLSSTTSTIPGVGTLVNQLPAVACAISVVGYVYRTTYLPPSGPPVVRYTPALAGIPTLIDVDGVGLPDFVGTLGVNLLGVGLDLTIARTWFFPSTGRVSIEAVAINPAAPDTYVGFGEDGTTAGTADNWRAAVSVLGLSSTTADIALDITASNRPSSLGVLGEMFSGPNPDAPDRTYRGVAGFAPVPAALRTEIRASQGRQQVIVNGTPSKLTAQVAVLTPGRDQRVDLTADQFPQTIDVVHTTGADSETTTYDASAPIGRLAGAYHDKVDGNIVTAAALDAWGVPEHIRFDQTAAATTVSATSGKFDRVQARFARGQDVESLDAGTSPFARFHRFTPTKLTAALQLSNLKSVSINQSAPYGGRLTFTSPPGLFPFTADDDVTSTHLEGSLSNLPADTTVSVDLDNGQVTFDGHGTGIDEIKLKATRPVPFFERATRLEATLEDLPALEVVDIKQAGETVSATASNPLGALTLLASDGSDAPSIAGSAASFEDTPALWRAFLRISGLTSVSFQADPVVGDLRTSQPQFLTVKGNVSGLTFDGSINQLPSHMTFSMGPGAGGSTVVDFDSHGESISEIKANGTGLPAPAGMPNFEALVKDLPSHLTLTLPPSAGGTAKFDAHGDHITRVYAQAWGSAKASVDAARQRLAYSEGQFVAANLLGVGNAEVSTSTSPFRIKYDVGAQPLDYAVKVSGADVHGTIANPQPATVTFRPFDKNADGEGGVKVTYRVDPLNHTGDGSIDQISLTATIGSAYINATVDHIPANLDICLQSEEGTLCKPWWTPGVQGYTVVPPGFAVHFFPTDLNGNVPATPVVVNGRVCPDVPTASGCNSAGQSTKHVVIEDLAFKTVEAAFGSHDEGCDVACGTVWAEASTFGPGSPNEGDHINGRVRYWDGEDNGGEPLLDLDLRPAENFIALNKLFFFLHYDAVPPSLDYASSGTLTCGAHPHLTIGLNNLPDPDVLDGTFGVC